MKRILDESKLIDVPLGRFDRFMQWLLRADPILPRVPKEDDVEIKNVIGYYLREVRNFPVAFTFTVLSVIVATVASVLAPYIFKEFVDAINGTAPQLSTLTHLVILFSLVGVAQWAGWRASYLLMGYIASHAIKHLRETAFTYLIHHSHRFFAGSFTGSLVQRVNRFAVSYDRLADRVIFDIIPTIIQIIAIGIVLYHIRPVIALIIFVWLALFVLWNWGFAMWKLKYDVSRAAADSRATATLADTITNQSTVELYHSHDREIARYHDQVSTQANLARFGWQSSAVIDGVQALFIIVAEFIVLYVGVILWSKGSLSVGSLILAQTYIIILSQRLWGFSRMIRDVYESFADAKEMVEIMLTPHEITEAEDSAPLRSVKGAIEYRNVSFSFNEKKVIEGLNLSIKPGERIAIVGLSGAGKSTLIKLLFRQYDPESGQVLIDGVDIKQASLRDLHDTLSLVPQDPILFHRTLMENIRYGRVNAADEEVYQAAAYAHADEFISRNALGYETLVGERGVRLSGGERQRVAIARAFVKDSPILVLDEATSSLDSQSEMLIQEALERLMKGRTTLVIAHRLSTIRKMDRIVVIDQGKVVEDGTHDDLIAKKSGIYARLWEIQQGGFVKDEEDEVKEAEDGLN